MKIAIIGSGMAGLTAGARLSQAGHEVAIFEQFHLVGGVTLPFERDGFRWDMGQLMVEGLGPDEPSGRILAELGVAGSLKLRKEDRGYVFPDFELKKPAEYAGPRWRIERLKELFPGEEKGLERYWQDYVRFTRLMTIGRQLERAGALEKLVLQSRMYAALLPFLPKLSWSAQKLMDSYFSSEKLKCVFVSILADFFTPPSQFQGLGVFMINPETSFDSRIPAELEKSAVQLYQYSVLGGINTLVQALVEKIQDAGGKIFTNCAVARIKILDGRVVGVEDRDGNRFPADVVIATGGAKETFFKLVGEELLPVEFSHKVQDLPLMESVFMIHLGLDYDPSPYLHGPVTYFYGTYDVESGLALARQGIFHAGKDGYVVHVPSLHSPEMAPAGKHAMTIYTICPDRLSEGSWQEHRLEYANKLLDCAEQRIPGLRDRTIVRAIVTPEDFRARILVDHHAFGGLAPLQRAARIPHQTPIGGLWFAGSQSESGGGINSVIAGAYRTATRIIK
jgi:phytoene dehydrogenase-like protein